MNTQRVVTNRWMVLGPLFCFTAASYASNVTTIAQAGGWDAYAGRSDDSRPLCGMSTRGGGRWLGIKYFKGDTQVTIQLSKDTWRARNGERVQVRMEFDERESWTAEATAFHMSDGDAALEFTIDRGQIDQWAKEFAVSNTLYIRFPQEEDIEDWQADLSSSQTIAGAWTLCMVAMVADT